MADTSRETGNLARGTGNRAIYLPARSASGRSKCVDISQEMAYRQHHESDPLSPKQHYSLVDSLEIDVEGKNEVIVKRALEKKFSTYNVEIDVDRCVPGMSALPVLETASVKRADVNVYNSNRTKLVLQIEVHSSPMRDTVCKAIYGAADILRLLRYTDKSFKSVTVLVFPKMEEPGCVGKVTVDYESLHFTYKLKWLTDVSTMWDEIRRILDYNIDMMPDIPHTDAVHNKYLTILSRQELGAFGIDAKQVISQFHVMVESDGKIYKVITDIMEEKQLALALASARQLTSPRHFIVPVMTRTTNVFSYDKVPYGPLKEQQACKYLKTLSEKICAALEELHRFGYAHSDVRLANVCFNSNYDAVLIDMERCTPIVETLQSPLCAQLGDISCMYRKPETIRGILTAKRLDYVQLGWLLVWELNCTGKYHEREWEKQPRNITDDVFLSQLVCQDVYSREALHSSLVHDSDENVPFSSLFQD